MATTGVPDWLPSLLSCPRCGATPLAEDVAGRGLHCRACAASLPVSSDVVWFRQDDEHEAVRRERSAVLEIERAIVGAEGFTFEQLMADRGELRDALCSLPYGNGSRYFDRENYFTSVSKFAAEFDYLVGQLRLAPGAFVLDLGADLTWSTARHASRGWRAVATDINHHLPAAAHFRQGGLAYATVNADMHAPAFGGAVFDAITAFNVLHHTHRLDELAARLAHVLRPGGVLAFLEPFCRNEEERAAFGRAQIEAGINENVYLLEEWHHAFRSVGLRRRTCLLTNAFAGVYEKPLGSAPARFSSLEAARDDFFARFYDAALSAPGSLPRVHPGAVVPVPVTIENRSDVTWASRGSLLPIFVGYHLHRVRETGTEVVAFDNPRTPLPAFLAPGARVEIEVPVAAPVEPGDYLFAFDLVQESRTWFSDRGVQTAAVRLQVR
jgi:SAM-dependent methyltransferase